MESTREDVVLDRSQVIQFNCYNCAIIVSAVYISSGFVFIILIVDYKSREIGDAACLRAHVLAECL